LSSFSFKALSIAACFSLAILSSASFYYFYFASISACALAASALA